MLNFMNLTVSIFGLIPLNSTNVTAIPVQGYTHQLIFLEVYFVFLIGVPLNLIVMSISFIDKSIAGNYKYLLGNLALCDSLFLCSLLFSNFVHLYIINNNMIYTPFSCTLHSILPLTFGISYLNVLPFISINRYYVIVLESGCFTNRIVFILSILVYWPLLNPVMAFLCPTYFVPDSFCGYNY
jgi:hypothetical protein